MDLVQLSADKDFTSRDKLVVVVESYYYLWMCELQRWLREEHNLEVLVYCNASGYVWEISKDYHGGNNAGGTHISFSDLSGPNSAGAWETHEGALEKGLEEALKLIK